MDKWEISKKQFLDITSKYIGDIKEKDGRIYFDSSNIVTSYYRNGDICRRHKEPCRLEIGKYNNGRICLSGYEKSYEIIGGFVTDFSEEKLREKLKIYNYSHKENYQYTLFDFL